MRRSTSRSLSRRPRCAPPSVTDSASVSASESDPNLANNAATANTAVTPVADVAVVSLTAAPTNVLMGQNVTFTVQVINNGPSTATGATVTDALPAGLTLVSATSTIGAVVTAGNLVTVNLGAFPSGGTGTVSIVAKASSAGTVNDTAAISANESDPNTSNNSQSTSVTVAPAADLMVQVTADPNPVNVNQDLTYTVTVTNNGPSPATGVTLTDTLPANVVFVSATSSQGPDPTQSGNVITALIGSLDVMRVRDLDDRRDADRRRGRDDHRHRRRDGQRAEPEPGRRHGLSRYDRSAAGRSHCDNDRLGS